MRFLDGPLKGKYWEPNQRCRFHIVPFTNDDNKVCYCKYELTREGLKLDRSKES